MNLLTYIVLILLSFVLFFLGGGLIPITDPTESVYALTAKEMLATGNWLSPSIYGDYWFDKPIMFYWELLIAYKIFGVNEFAARFFPAVFATLGLFLTYAFGAKLYDKKIGLMAAVMLATSLEYWYLSHAVITDMTLLTMFAATLMSFYLGYRAGNPRFYAVAYAASGVAVLTKGPIGFFLPGLIILIFLAWQNDLRHLQKLFRAKYFLILIAIIALWYLPMTLIHGAEFLENFLGVHNFLRATISEYPKADVWYYYTAISLIGFFPWSLVLIFLAIKNSKNYALRITHYALNFDRREKFLIVWTLTVIIFFQLCATKYVTYTLPAMIPAMIFFAKFLISRRKIFNAVAMGAIIIYPLLTICAAVPLTEENSARREAQIILPLIDKNTCVVSHGKDYDGSLVFYTSATIYRLETAQVYEKLKPQKMTWTSKNVMPFMTFDKLPADKKIIAVVGVDFDKNFLSHVSGYWQLIGEVKSKSKIYLREANNFAGTNQHNRQNVR